ncbi:MAG: hypothetical protein ACJ71J_12265 [Nitrososphaeraceae archaeon]
MCVVKPSVARVIFLSSKILSTSSFLIEDEDASTVASDISADDIAGVSILDIYLFERLGI